MIIVYLVRCSYPRERVIGVFSSYVKAVYYVSDYCSKREQKSCRITPCLFDPKSSCDYAIDK